jgi:4-hydroxy-3-polyprenylbenzoate decarboxylase
MCYRTAYHMGYRLLRDCVHDLIAAGRMLRVAAEVDAELEAAEIHRRVYRSGGPALFFENVARCRFPMVSNLFGTYERARFMFRDTWDRVCRLIELKVDSSRFWQHPWDYVRALPLARHMRPRLRSRGSVLAHRVAVHDLPQLKSWPDDGGAFITLPLVYTEDPDRPGSAHANLGMYRVQLSGGRYAPDRQVGLHYQIHRGIGVHHASAARRGEPLRANVFVGGTPAMSLAAVVPLPEGMSELTLAGALAGHRIPLVQRPGQLPIYSAADFALVGHVDPCRTLPEGPFGDHLGYYSLVHEYPVMEVEAVFHRDGAIWPFTVVGRPPQEDTVFGQLIHELTGPAISTVSTPPAFTRYCWPSVASVTCHSSLWSVRRSC